ncbi:UDP-GlcNAc:betaGal beta-1,3-N-acetylglucosaminyltransferase 8 [Monodelphis domestica]|uniref:UDP-GlcNAc:betaGal beta-1,3-N-acetylglucosaminyltransferase 8 n=1 Tax=Monodelphis domestica TaxID=13616 RepID=UPI0000D90F3C|nr:UDP-GlcNAc:betaGal beta-1,3-N-acetylglucosaminyltransferase 8 [Monodelphis domestica]
MRCSKCLLCVLAGLTLLALKVYIEWSSDPLRPKRRGEGRGPETLSQPSALPPEPSLPANLSARLRQTGPLATAFWNRQQRQLQALPTGAGSAAGDCRTWGEAAAAEIPDFSSYPEAHRRFLLSAACRDYPRWESGSAVPGCPDADAPYLLLAVKSSAGRFGERQAIRETWGAPEDGVRLLFLLGSPQGELGPDLGPLVEWESRRYRDLLLWDFLDVPFNRSLLDVLLLRWLARHCPQVTFVLRAQDDSFVNLRALLGVLRGLPPATGRTLYLGHVFDQALPIRTPKGPYYVPETFYDGPYPAYASGGGYVFAGRLVPWLLQAARRVVPFPIDDVYTGLCFQALGLAPQNHPGFLTNWPTRGKQDNPCAQQSLVLVQPRDPQETIRLWKLMQPPHAHC